jgi:hypothetical protein
LDRNRSEQFDEVTTGLRLTDICLGVIERRRSRDGDDRDLISGEVSFGGTDYIFGFRFIIGAEQEYGRTMTGDAVSIFGG